MAELQKINTDVFINLRDRTENIIVSANRGDAHSRTIRFNFIYEDEIYEIPEGIVARFMGTRPDGYAIMEEEPCTIIGNQVLYEMTPYVLNISGDVKAKIELRNDETEQILTTVSFIIHIPKDPFDENAIIKTDEFSVLNVLIKKVEKALDDVEEALVRVDETIDEANKAIEIIYDTNEKMQEVISDAENVIDDMNDKLDEADEKIAEWQKDIDTTISNAEKAIDDTIAKAQEDIDSMLSDAENDLSDIISKAESATDAAKQATENANKATEDAEKATDNANKATFDSITATENADKATERAIAAAKAAEEAAAREIPIATTTNTGVVKASTQVAVAKDGTMSIVSVPLEALPEDVGNGGLEQYTLFSSLPNEGKPTVLYIVTSDEEELNGMYYWDPVTSSYIFIETGDENAAIIVDITWAEYQALSEEEKNNGLVYNIIDDFDDVVFSPHGEAGQILRYDGKGNTYWDNETSPFIIQEEEPSGNEKKTWIKPSTHVQHYYDGTTWVPLAAVWG